MRLQLRWLMYRRSLQVRWLMYRRSLQVRWLMYLRWRRRRCKIQARNGPITVWDRRNGSPCQQDYTTQIGETKGYSWTYLPEEILRHIHSLMPLRDAARAACVCRAFLCSWRSFPNLTFSNQTLGLNENARGKDEIARDFTNKVDQIMKNHLGTGVKTLKLLDAPNYNRRYNRCLDSWLEKAVTPGIEELTLAVAGHFVAKRYKFPCSVLLCGNGDSIRHVSLEECAFRPTDGFGCLRSLIPCLPRLTHLSVTGCCKLKMIESKAPKLSSFHFESPHHVQLSLGKALQVKKLYIDCSDPVSHSRAELASSTQNLEVMHPSNEMVNSPLVSSKLLYLERLSITLGGSTFSQSFDYFSAVSSPSLETFILDVSQRLMEHPFYDEICSFSDARTWVNLTYHLLKAWLS